ncbi:MAG: hypothetical protein FWC62_09170, partial [Firmicutes bacterium]|nr:hypothetical protein [Bacillota bacterium]
MGLAGYVGGRRVIVGIRQLLESHGISAPDIEVERRLQRNGGYPLYVAEDGALCALLSIGYEVDERIAAPLRRLIYREGFSLAVATRDPNCTGAMLRKLFRLPKNTADTMAAATADSFRADTEERVEESGGMAYTGGFPAFAALLESVVALGKGVYRALIAMCVLAVLGLVAVLEYSAFGDAGMTTLIPVLLFQLVATAALFVSTNFRRK